MDNLTILNSNDVFSRPVASMTTYVLNIRGYEKLMQQPKFKEHPLLKAIMERVSRRGYMDITAFVDDFTR